MTSEWSMDRRSAIKIGLAAVALGVLGGPAIASPAARAGLRAAVAGPVGAVTESLPDPVRYEFAVATKKRLIGVLGRLEEVWSFRDYTRIVACVVTYVGGGDYVLTLEESAVVKVAEDAGAVIADRPAYYLEILAACTRISPKVLQTRLAELGVPGVSAALALAPMAPQAGQMRTWLEANGG
jgi:hypothetical protein